MASGDGTSGFPLRAQAAVGIAIGGAMHILGLLRALGAGVDIPWWMYAVFGIAIVCYPLSAIGVALRVEAAELFAFAGPLAGGALILAGFVFPPSRLIMLIPGTLTDEIAVVGFVTLIVEPVAAICALQLLFQRRAGRKAA